jgi:outer membrane immunogenic protein
MKAASFESQFARYPRGLEAMKKIALATTVLSMLFAGSASAADLAARPYTKAPPPIVAVYNWTGFYVGINGGYASAHKCWDLNAVTGVPVVPAFPEGCHDATGGTVGGQIGYRWQASNWVFGLEAQGNWADLKGSNTSNNVFATAYTNRTRVDSIGLFTGQIGYSWNTFLLYVKGGAAVTHDKYDAITNAPFGAFPTGTLFDQGSETRWGGVVGVGGEFAFSPNWSLALEYDHLFMGNRNLNFTAAGNLGLVAGSLTRGENIRQDVDMVTARINYRFGGPVVARY